LGFQKLLAQLKALEMAQDYIGEEVVVSVDDVSERLRLEWEENSVSELVPASGAEVVVVHDVFPHFSLLKPTGAFNFVC